MNRYTLIFCIAVLTSCAAELPSAPPSELFSHKQPVALTAICTPGNPNSFVGAIRLLRADYEVDKNGANYSPPILDSNSTPFDSTKNVNITNDLKLAFSNAPPFFQEHLCNTLDGIFISTAACSNQDAYNCTPNTTSLMKGAWGLRSRSNQDRGKKYITISAALWPAGSSSLQFNDYEVRLLRAFPGGSDATIGVATPNDSWMTVLAALAHELGHVRWATTTIKTTGGSSTFTELHQCARQTRPGSTDFFFAWRYLNDKFLELPGATRWRVFGKRDTAGGPAIDHIFSPTLSQLGGANYNQYLYALYQNNQPWASLFGAQSADEDFVETYVMYVLTGYSPDPQNPNNDSFASNLLKSLPLNVPGQGTVDLPKGLVNKLKPTLQNKMSCIPVTP